MSSKNARSGGKYSGTHTTVIPTVTKIIDAIEKDESVTKISLGFIKGGLTPSRGNRRIKIGFGLNGCILLTCRGNTSAQEIRVYSRETHTTKSKIARYARDLNWDISFEKNRKILV